jgi:diadenosine tetraphosphate (Ap4A) HIT family hydrolase
LRSSWSSRSRATAEFTCKRCGFGLYHPIANLTVSTLGLYDDARFPGRCILAYGEHVEDFLELQPSAAAAFTEDARRAARAISRAVSADRMNYAILGNVAPHLHCHLIPRRWVEDPVPGQSPWKHPESVRSLPEDRRGELVAAIAAALGT